MKNFTTIVLVFLTSALQAQTGWNWPEDEGMFDQAKEKQAYYQVLMDEKKYEEALSELKWLYDNNANLNPSIYIDGTSCTEKAIKLLEDPTRIAELQDSALWMYDARIKYFGNEASVLDRKAYTAFKYYYKTPEKYGMLISIFERAYELNGVGISDFNLTPYMLLAKYAYENGLEEMPREKILETHSLISRILDEKEKSGGDYGDTQDKIDAFLSSIKGLLDCEYIEKQLVPKLDANPGDFNLAKKIFSYSLQAKCSGQPYFMRAAEVIGENEPTYNLAKLLGEKWYSAGAYEKALKQFTTANELAENYQDAYEALMSQAKTAIKMGQKSNARLFAKEALKKKPEAKEPYNLIGNLYFNSFDECAEKKDIVIDRAIYIAAYNMYNKARNTERMAAAKEQFPSIDELFNSGYEEGEYIEIGCWINKKVLLQRR